MTNFTMARGFVRVVCAIGVAAGVAAPVSAAPVTSAVWEVSQNGGAYGPNVFASPGDVIRVRLRVSLTGNSGAGSIGGAGGFAGMTFLPLLSNFSGLDVVTPIGAEQWPEGSPENPFPGVINHPTMGVVTNVYTGSPTVFRGPGSVSTGLGRIAPWGAVGIDTNGKPSPAVQSGILSWRAAVVGMTGVPLVQREANYAAVNAIVGVDDLGTPGDPSDDELLFATVGTSFNALRANVVPFAYEFVVGDAGPRVMTQSATVSTQGGAWWTQPSGVDARWAPVEFQAATITILVPSPSAVGVLGMAVLAWGGRRRR